ncbi:MAG: hypothetical protein HYY51_03110 [Candidatus Magasanikbacteria bacterium]|nr:hypothetical protein [Candidatus Magasanikbacteria bacterium]
MKHTHISVLMILSALLLVGQGCVLGGGSGPSTSGPAGIFASTNAGEDWQSVSFVPTVFGVRNVSGLSVFRLVEDPHDSKTLYWLTRDSGLLYSYDDGKSWQQSVEPFNTGFVYSLNVHPESPCTLVASNGRQIFRSIDCSRSWKEIYREGRPEVVIRSVAHDPFPPYDIYALGDNGDLIKSLDKGLSWNSVIRLEIKALSVVFDAKRQGLLYISTRDRGLYRSLTGGSTWVDLSDKLGVFPGALEYRSFIVYPTEANHIYWVSKYGVLVSKNAGEDWEAIELITPPGGVSIYGFAVNPRNEKEIYYTGTVGVKSTFYRTLDGGRNWVTKRLPSNQIPTILRAHPDQPGWLYMGFTIPQAK